MAKLAQANGSASQAAGDQRQATAQSLAIGLLGCPKVFQSLVLARSIVERSQPHLGAQSCLSV